MKKVKNFNIFNILYKNTNFILHRYRILFMYTSETVDIHLNKLLIAKHNRTSFRFQNFNNFINFLFDFQICHLKNYLVKEKYSSWEFLFTLIVIGLPLCVDVACFLRKFHRDCFNRFHVVNWFKNNTILSLHHNNTFRMNHEY